MVLHKIGSPLLFEEVPIPKFGKNEILIKVKACALCRTDLHIIDGDLPSPTLPRILGHQIVGSIVALGDKTTRFKKGDRVGIAWLGKSCGNCFYCHSLKENLCNYPLFTGYQRDGGFAEFCVADSDFVFPLPQQYSDTEIAPLLCGGMIGYRSLRLTEGAEKIGFYGFGSSAHILIQVVNFRRDNVYAFTRSGDRKGQEFARSLGALWAGSIDEPPPHLLDAAILFAPVGAYIPLALSHIRKGGIVVSAGIHMSDIPSFPYHLLWEERVIKSVANLTRQDGFEFLKLAEQIPLKTQVTLYPLEKTNEALEDLRHGKFSGSAVISMD